MFVPSETGEWVSEKFERLARVVQDYDPQFELRWIPPEHRVTPEDHRACYMIVDIITNLPVATCGELDTPEDLLTQLFNSDNKHGDVLTRLEARENAKRILQMKEEMDAAEERKEYAAWLMGTNKNYINMGNGRVVDDQLRTVRPGKK